MDFSYSEEQTSLRDLARKIFEDLTTNDRLKEIERRDPATRKPVRALRAVRLSPAREERIDRPALDRLSTELARQVAEQGWGVPTRRRVLEELRCALHHLRRSADRPVFQLLSVMELPLVYRAQGHPTGVFTAALRRFAHSLEEPIWLHMCDIIFPLASL